MLYAIFRKTFCTALYIDFISIKKYNNDIKSLYSYIQQRFEQKTKENPGMTGIFDLQKIF
jgi:hypothetical protein